MRRRQQSEPVDLEEAVKLYYKQVYGFAMHLSKKPEEAADLTQHAYEQLARKHHQVDDPSRIKAWLQSTVYRKFIDKRRKVIRFPHVEFDEEQAHAPLVASRVGERIDAQTAMEALGELEEDLRAPLSLFYLNACSYKEIAGILDLPTGTVMSRLYRGKEKLYQLLTETSHE